MNLMEFYFQNIQNTEYHYRFYNLIKQVEEEYNIFSQNKYDSEFELYDAEEAITKFKKLCQPEVSFSENDNKCWFYIVTYYLFKCGYRIKEFPRVLARPPENPYDFTYNDIRNKIIEQGDDEDGVVRYKERRIFIKNLTFEIKSEHLYIDDSINQKFMEISNRHVSFSNMSTDEKLEEIANLIENLLKKDKDYIIPQYQTICFEYISDNDVKNYRKRIQCFRHATGEAIEERKGYTEEQKSFLIDYGITILNVIYSLVT